jgi:glycosyltransferase involved in cell wall biosynthesis
LVRVCLVYDLFYPNTVGGAERWYRGLASALVAEGHEVTYLTRRVWEPGDEPEVPGVRIVPVAPGGEVYTQGGRRRLGEPMRFGLGVLKHLARHRGAYDIVHSCAFPYFSVPAIRLALAGRPVEIGIDWFELWSAAYWRSYLGAVGGAAGYLTQRLSVRLTPRAFVFSETHGRRLRKEGMRGPVISLAGLYAGQLPPEKGPELEPDPIVLFAGRHIPEKRAHVLPAAIAKARESIPALQGLILGDGPQRPRVLAEISNLGVQDVVHAPGFVEADKVDALMRRALCIALPSSREGYGLVVVEAAAHGTPSIVVDGPDNAAVELVQEDENGFVTPSADPADIAAAIVRVHASGRALRERTARWVERRSGELRVESSLKRVLNAYSSSGGRGRGEARWHRPTGSIAHDSSQSGRGGVP